MGRVSRTVAWLLVGLFLGVTVAIYLPGLSGGFVYDDVSFIVENAAVQVASTDWRDWMSAAFSFPGGVHQGRWLGMLSFAANHYFSGLDPFAFKFTNLAIHLLNGLLVFAMLRALFALREETASEPSPRFDGRLAAAAIAGLWLVLPINVTAVLYVSQRLEALSNTFVFLGLAWYLRARLRHWRGEGGSSGLWLSLIACTGVGALVKESAILLPLYAACVEIAITRARTRDGQARRDVLVMYAALLGLPLIVGVTWLGTWVFGHDTYARPFDTWQRLISEARVLADYIGWTLVPNLDTLTLHHDDIQASRGLFDPPTTLLSMACLAALAGIAIWQRRRRPLLSLGLAWFFCGHLLTGTIIPLLLAFEHRNYFPSIGLLLACASLVESMLRRPSARIAIVAIVACFYAFTTWMRAEEWSQPMRLTMSEASKRPRSPTAQYDRAAALVGAGTVNGRPVIEDGILALEDNRNLPGAGIVYEAALIALFERRGNPASPAWWDSLIEKLRANPPSIGDAQSLEFLSTCFVEHECKEGLPNLAKAYATALAHPSPSAYLLSSNAEFAWQLQGDTALAEKQFRAAVAKSPYDAQARRHLVMLLISTGNFTEAQAEIDAVRRINQLGNFDRLIRSLESAWQAAKGSAHPA